MDKQIKSISLDERNRNEKGRFIKGHLLGLRFGFGQKVVNKIVYTEELRKKMSEVHKGIKHSKETKKKMSIRMKGIKNIAKRKDVREKISKALKGKKQPWNSGKNHWNWQGGISEGNRQLNRKKEKDWRFKILIRDNFTCWICEIKGEKLEVHHLMSYAKYPKLRFIISNGLTLCKFCHKTYTEIGGKTHVNSKE